jgi:hypothetical protein
MFTRYTATHRHHNAIAARFDTRVNATFVETMMQRTICKFSVGAAAEA